MSHFTLVKSNLKDQESLIQALCQMGFNLKDIEISKELLKLKGYAGDFRKQKANIRLKGSGWGKQNVVGSASNDLGFEQMPDGTFAFHVSEYDLRKYGNQWQQELFANYSQNVTIKTLQEEGFELEESVHKNKAKRQLILRRTY